MQALEIRPQELALSWSALSSCQGTPKNYSEIAIIAQTVTVTPDKPKSMLKKMGVVVSKSEKPNKRLKATFPNKNVHFGSKKGSTFVDHGNADTKVAWEARHRVKENWTDWDTAGALAKNILWNKPSMKASVSNLNARQSQYKFRPRT